MTAFREYMWELLTRPFRKDNSVVVKAYTLIIGSILDDTMACPDSRGESAPAVRGTAGNLPVR